MSAYDGVMFVGHIAVGFLARRVMPSLSLAFLVFCTVFLDVLWPIFILTGVEHAAIVPGITAASPLDLRDFPWSHSLVMSVAWSLLAAIPWILTRRWLPALVIGGCVFSHFVLDVVSHRPDVPLYPGGTLKIGLGLWNSRAGTVIVEGGLWAVALVLYARANRPTSGWGRWGLWALVAVLTAGWLEGIFGAPPPSITMVAASALPFIALVTGWLWTVERRRKSVATAITSTPR
jgi:hypothetical protein